MKKFKILALLSGALLMGGAGAAAGKCTDDPLVFSLSFTYVDGKTPAAFYSDGTGGSNPSYVDGVDGVAAILHVCGTNPTHDAILILAQSKRSMGIDLRRLVHRNDFTPAWTTTPFLSQGVLKVRNILFNYNPTAPYSFKTRAGYDFPLPNPPKNTWYHVRMQNPDADAVLPNSTDLIVNDPLNTSLVFVEHIPATAATRETWKVYPDATIMGLTDSGANATQVGTLLQGQNNGTPVNLGQFFVPFVITITRK